MSVSCILQGQNDKSLKLNEQKFIQDFEDVTQEVKSAIGIDVLKQNVNEHIANKNNPHKITTEQIGAAKEDEIGSLYLWEKSDSEGNVEYVTNSDKSAYPEDGEQGGYKYTLKGQIGDKLSNSDGFQVGDILLTSRNDLDDTWQLCNGEENQFDIDLSLLYSDCNRIIPWTFESLKDIYYLNGNIIILNSDYSYYYGSNFNESLNFNSIDIDEDYSSYTLVDMQYIHNKYIITFKNSRYVYFAYTEDLSDSWSFTGINVSASSKYYTNRILVEYKTGYAVLFSHESATLSPEIAYTLDSDLSNQSWALIKTSNNMYNADNFFYNNGYIVMIGYATNGSSNNEYIQYTANNLEDSSITWNTASLSKDSSLVLINYVLLNNEILMGCYSSNSKNIIYLKKLNINNDQVTFSNVTTLTAPENYYIHSASKFKNFLNFWKNDYCLTMELEVKRSVIIYNKDQVLIEYEDLNNPKNSSNTNLYYNCSWIFVTDDQKLISVWQYYSSSIGYDYYFYSSGQFFPIISNSKYYGYIKIKE